MGMFGMGQAFSARFRTSGPYRGFGGGMRMPMMPPRMPMARGPIFMFGGPPQHCHHSNGPLWAGLIGFGLGGLFGFLTRKNQPQMMSPYGGMYGQGGYGPAAQQGLQNLQTLYGSKYNIVQNPDGSYTVATKDGQTVSGLERASYEQVVSAMGGNNTSSTPGSSTTTSSTPGSSTTTSSTPGSSTTTSSTPGSSTTTSSTPGSSTTTSSTPGSSTTTSSTPGSSTTTSSTPGSSTTTSSTPGSSTTTSSTPGSSTTTSSTPGSSTTTSSTPGSSTPGSSTPGSSTPGSSTPGSSTPGSSTPGSSTPGSSTPGSSTPGSSTPDSNTPTEKTHTVKSGENLWNIAKNHLKDTNGTEPSNAEILKEVKRLMEVNDLDYTGSNGHVLIRPGDVIKFGTAEDAKSRTASENSEQSQKVQSKTGRYAEKDGDTWKYYAKDGTQLNPAHIQKNDPELWEATKTTGNKNDSIYTAKNGDFITKDKNGNLHYFDKNGNEMTEKDFKGEHNTINTTNIKNGGYSSQKGTRVQSKTGRWAEKDGDTWKYYAKDGTQLNPAHIQKNDPELWEATKTTGNKNDSIYTAKNRDFITKDKNGNLHYFDKNGNEMTEKDFKGEHNTINTTNIKNGGYSSQKGTRVQSKTGRWAEKDGNSWKYYAKDGTQLNPAHIQKNDPELWKATHPGQ